MIHQTQPTSNSCISACLAMLAALPADYMTDRFHSAIWEDGVSVGTCLEELGVVHYERFYGPQTVFSGKVYLVRVASLNTVGGLHEIILDCRGDTIEVFDPAFGMQNKFYYAWEPTKGDDKWAVPLESWLIEYEVVPHD